MADQPLAARMRPRTTAEFVGQTHLVAPGRALQKLLDRGSLPSLILWGPAGTGKTTLAHLLAEAVGAQLVTLSAVSSGVADARKVMEAARQGGLFRTALFVDEVHRWSKAQQDVLLPAVEDGTVTLIGATTENPYFSLNTPLLSRCLLLRLEPLGPDDLKALVARALADEERGLGGLGLTIAEDALEHLVTIAGGDARMALTGLEAAALAASSAGETEISLELAADAVQRKAVVYDRGDAHYDVISAFIKSIRGSDPDAALFWLARMLEAGEDARFIARRLIVHASEDVGLADPMALLQAVAAAHAVEHVGLPEARLNLAQATIYLARAPKSNSVVTAIGAALEDAASADPVPTHLRDASYPGARKLGHGKGYVYPHDQPGHHADQAYRPPSYEGRRYYEPSGMGEDTDAWTPGAGPSRPDPATG
jgi:putative ATPase